MSISTLESLQSRSMLAALDAHNTELAIGEQAARDEIASAFAQVRKVPAAHISLPTVMYRGDLGMRVVRQRMSDAVMELLGEGRCDQAVMQVLQSSDCPHVQNLREALCAEWQRQWALEVAEARV